MRISATYPIKFDEGDTLVVLSGSQLNYGWGPGDQSIGTLLVPSTTTFQRGTWVISQGSTEALLIDGAPTPAAESTTPAPGAIPEWTASTQYVKSQAVTAYGKAWIARDDHYSSARFDTDQNAHWTVFSGASSFVTTLAMTGSPIAPGSVGDAWVAPIPGQMLGVAADADGTLVVDVTRNGTTIFSTTANRPAMAASGGFLALERPSDQTAFQAGDKFAWTAVSTSKTAGDWAGSSSVLNGSALTNPTVTLPQPTSGSVIALNDFIFVHIKVNTADTTATTVAPPSGFTEIGTGVARTNAWEMHVFWKKAAAGDVAAANFTMAVTGSITGYQATLTTYRNLTSGASPIDVTGGVLTPQIGSNLTVPSLVPTTADDIRLVFMGWASGTTVGSPSTMTTRNVGVFERKVVGKPTGSGADVIPLSLSSYAGAISVLLVPGVANDATTSKAHLSLRYTDASLATVIAPPDTSPPTVPGSVVATPATSTRINLSWSASTDNVAVTGYRIKRNGGLIATIGATTSYSDLTCQPSTTYSYTVEAFDAGGNSSGPSTAATATTSGAPAGVYVVDGLLIKDPTGSLFVGRGANNGIDSSIGNNQFSDESVTNATNGTPHIAEFSEWGWNMVRAVVNVSDSTSWIKALGRQNAWNKIKTYIDLWRSLGVVVIVTPMDMTGAFAGRVADHENDIIDFFGYMPAFYTGDSGVWWNINEPNPSISGIDPPRTGDYNTDWRTLHERAYAAIRTTAGNPNIYIVDAPGAAQDPGPGQVAGLGRVYDANMGPAFLVGKTNVAFALHNYGWQGSLTGSLSTYIQNYRTYFQNCQAAGLAMIVNEAGYDSTARLGDGSGVNTRMRYGFQSSLALIDDFSLSFNTWGGTPSDLDGLKWDRSSGGYQSRPYWYGGSSRGLSDQGAHYWNYLHPTALVPEMTVYPTVSPTTAYAAGLTLTCSPGTWLNSGTITYQWRLTVPGSVLGALIPGANSPAYVVQPSDVATGNRLSCIVTNTNTNGSSKQDTPYVTSV